MKKLIPLVFLLLSSQALLWAQQDPQFSQFFLNKLNYNPGYAGSEEKICALGVYRAQWVGMGSSKDGLAPTTILASINGPIGDKIGIGLNIYTDQLGFEKSTVPTLSLSYKFRFANDGVLAPGIGIGFMQKTLAGDKFKALDAGDPKIPNIPVSGNTFDLSGGLYYSQPTLSIFDKFYAGVSAMHLNQGSLNYSWSGNSYAYTMSMHYFFMMGAEYRISNTLAIDPNIVMKTDLTKYSTDINAMLVYNDKFKGGLSYRTGNDISLLLGFKITPDIQIGYSYDLTLSNLGSYNNGSHEILLKYCFMPHFKTPPPKEPIPRLTPRFL